MESRLFKKTGISFLVVVLAVILVSGGLLAACSRTQTTTTTTATTSAISTTTTVRPTATTTATTATTSATSTTTTVTTSAPSTAATVSAADFYRNNVVALVCPYGPGGNTDYVARLFANYWTQVTGGRMVVENKEGGGGLNGNNYAYAAKPDGLTIGEALKNAQVASVLARDPAIRFDFKKMNWLIFTSPGEADGLALGAKSPYTSMADIMKGSGLKFASSGRTSTTSINAGLLIELFGLKDGRIVLGYGGAAECLLAVAKGEADAYVMDGPNLVDCVRQGFTKPPSVILDYKRIDYYPDVPAVPELLKLSPEQDSLLRTVASLRGGQMFWFQPGVPQDRIDFVRAAFDKIVNLDGYLKQYSVKYPKYVPPTSGKDFAAEMEKTLAAATPERFTQLMLLVDKYAR